MNLTKTCFRLWDVTMWTLTLYCHWSLSVPFGALKGAAFTSSVYLRRQRVVTLKMTVCRVACGGLRVPTVAWLAESPMLSNRADRWGSWARWLRAESSWCSLVAACRSCRSREVTDCSVSVTLQLTMRQLVLVSSQKFIYFGESYSHVNMGRPLWREVGSVACWL
jgi:hypothetical protein